MFSTHRSEVILPVDIANGSTPYALNYVAGVNYERSLLFIKASNFGDDTIPLALEIGADWNVKNATVEILKADNATAWNKPNIENKVEPEMASVELYNNKLSYEMPPYSVAVFSVAF
jgi:alpha-L-arabinofuranosidase